MSVNFDTECIIQRAIEQSGLDDFGIHPYREGLDTLLETYDRWIEDPAGRSICFYRIDSLLQTRLRWEAALKREPSIHQQQIKAPIFITGLPRSGTSALLNLLESAPDNRAPLQWEVQFPDLYLGTQPNQEDPRYRALVKSLKENANDEFNKIHFIDADTPEECVLLHAFAFDGAQMGFEGLFEPYSSWVKDRNLESMYQYELLQLKMLNWRNPGKQWLLKTPAHLWGINAILKVFPDARFIWCHRNPVEVVASINSMNRAVMKMVAGDCSHLDNVDIGRKLMEWYALSAERAIQVRSQLPEYKFLDCTLEEFETQPMAVVKRIYDYFRMPLEDNAKLAMQQYIQRHPKNKHGKHEYDLATYGLNEMTVKQRFEFYTTQYNH